jgi:hypothetical protein
MSQHGVIDSLTTTASSDETQEQPILLASRIVHKFYEPIILLAVLTDAVKNIAQQPPPVAPINIEDPKQVFCAFVNKLCHVCDKTRGGSTVTSCVITRRESNRDQAHYEFAANQQTDSELNATTVYVEGLLRKVDQAPKDQDNQRDTRISLLYDILCFNRPRITVYFRDLHSRAARCVEECQTDMTTESMKSKYF